MARTDLRTKNGLAIVPAFSVSTVAGYVKALRSLFCLIGMVCGLSATVLAAGLGVTVTDPKDRPLSDAVVTLTPLFETNGLPPVSVKAEMVQEGTIFVPFVLPVKVGSVVDFPNRDPFRHHVYSFSKTKTFELRLYSQTQENSVIFDTAGVAALGCNIHDNMLAYVFVTEAPVFGTTDADGRLTFTGLPEGDYTLEIWHPDLKKKANGATQRITITEPETATLRVPVDVRSFRRRQRGPDGTEDY